jgi:hypothetical protein
MIRLILAVLGAILEILGWVRWSHPPQPLKDLTPVDAVAGIADALRTYPIIGLSSGDGHGDERGPAFVIALIRDSRISAAATDVVMEGANGRYQAVMDRYVRGESVPDAELRPIWDDTTQQQIPGPVWSGQVPAIYRAVREVNTTLPRDRQIRALLGDPPIEWENVHTPAEFHTWLAQRDSYPADLIQREVIAKNRRALVFFGGGHLQRRQQLTNYVMDDPIAQTVVSLVERAGIKTFIVRHGTEKEGMSGWPVPSLARLRGTRVGAGEEPSLGNQRVAIRNGAFIPIPREQGISLRREEQTDAIVYLGPAPTRREAPLPHQVCGDPKYVQVRLQRMAIAGLPPSEPQRLKQLCGV